MREAAANKKCADVLVASFPRGVYYKHCDKMSSGRPDSTFTWRGVTSWLEFKMLEGDESVHTRNPRDTHGLAKDQLVELLRLERAGSPAWVIAFRKATRTIPEHTTIYRPTSLITVAAAWTYITPTWREYSHPTNVLHDLTHDGVAAFAGLDYRAVAALIQQTHHG